MISTYVMCVRGVHQLFFDLVKRDKPQLFTCSSSLRTRRQFLRSDMGSEGEEGGREGFSLEGNETAAYKPSTWGT